MRKRVTFGFAAIAAAALTACGGGGADSIGNDLVQVSIDSPSGAQTAGKLVTIRGTAKSNNSPLESMTWTVNNAGVSDSAVTLNNANCSSAGKAESAFGNGSSVWSCVVSMLAPSTLSAKTEYNVTLSAKNKAGYGGNTTTKVTLDKAPTEPNPIEVVFDPVPADLKAGEVIALTGRVSSSASKLTSARWVVLGSRPTTPGATVPHITPSLTNSDCTDSVQVDNPSGQGSSIKTCTVKMVVPKTMPVPMTFTLGLVGTNEKNFSLSEKIDVSVGMSAAASNKIEIDMANVPATATGGDKVSLRSIVTSTTIKLDAAKTAFAVAGVSPSNPAVSAADNMVSATTCTETAGTMQQGSRLDCSAVLTTSATPTVPLTYTVSLSSGDVEGNKNVQTKDIVVSPGSDPFGLRADVGIAPGSTVAGGTDVTLTCVGAGAPTGTAYKYLWRVTNSGGVVIPLSTTNVDSGTVTFKAPTVTQDTDVALECVVSANSKTATTPATLKILKPTP